MKKYQEFIKEEFSKNDPMPDIRDRDKLGIILLGVPGSGKSTFASNFIIPHNRNIKKFSTDDISYLITKDKGKYHPPASDLNISALKIYIKTGQNFIYDTTGANDKAIFDITNIAHENGYKIIFIFMLIDIETAKKQNYRRAEIGGHKADDDYIDHVYSNQLVNTKAYLKNIKHEGFYVVLNKGGKYKFFRFDDGELKKRKLDKYVSFMKESKKTSESFGSLFDELSGYNLDPDDFAVFGSAPLYVSGKIDKINDLDIIIRPDKWHLYFDTEGEFRTKNIEFFNNWPGFDIDDLIDNNTFIVDGIKFINTEKVIEYKSKMKRDKDSYLWKNESLDESLFKEINIQEVRDFYNSHKYVKFTQQEINKLESNGINNIYKIGGNSLRFDSPFLTRKKYSYDNSVFKFEDEWFIVKLCDSRDRDSYYLCDTIDGVIEYSKSNKINEGLFNNKVKFNIDGEELFEMIDYNDLVDWEKKHKRIRFSSKEHKKISNIKNIKFYPHYLYEDDPMADESIYIIKSNNTLYRKYISNNYESDIKIVKYEDEWFILTITLNFRKIFYKCDTIEGVIQILENRDYLYEKLKKEKAGILIGHLYNLEHPEADDGNYEEDEEDEDEEDENPGRHNRRYIGPR